MIRISAPWKESSAGYTYVKATLEIDAQTCEGWKAYCGAKENENFTKYLGDNYTDRVSGKSVLWYAVDEKYGDYACTDRADAFVVSLLHYAMASGSDIVSEAPVSSTLLYNIRTELIPHLCRAPFKAIHVEAPVVSELCPSQNAAATAMSGGIDSFFTLWQHQQEGIPEDYRLKYLTFFNVGAINAIFDDSVPLEKRNQVMLEVSQEKSKMARDVAKECGLEFVFINSNISDYYCGMIVNSAHYRNCGAAMILQGMWNKYYYSSAGLKPDDIRMSPFIDPAYCEDMLLPWLSNGTLRFYATGHAYGRLAKTAILADYPLAQKHLNVCDNTRNCGKCKKCVRTLATLLAIKKLDSFGECFDLKEVAKRIPRLKREIYLRRKQRFFDDIFRVAQKNHLFSAWEKAEFALMSIPYSIAHKSRWMRNLHAARYRKELRKVK